MVAIIMIIAFVIPLILVSYSLKELNITEHNLWKGSESKWTSILRGSNMDSLGGWNEEDEEIINKYNDDYEAVEKACKEIVFNRLTKTPLPKVIAFYGTKYGNEWMLGDFAGTYWAKASLEENSFGYKFASAFGTVANYFYFLLLVCICIGLFNKKQYLKNHSVNLLYILLIGYISFYIIIENQSRYPFIVSWLFIILPFAMTLKKGKIIKRINKTLV